MPVVACDAWEGLNCGESYPAFCLWDLLVESPRESGGGRPVSAPGCSMTEDEFENKSARPGGNECVTLKMQEE